MGKPQDSLAGGIMRINSIDPSTETISPETGVPKGAILESGLGLRVCAMILSKFLSSLFLKGFRL